MFLALWYNINNEDRILMKESEKPPKPDKTEASGAADENLSDYMLWVNNLKGRFAFRGQANSSWRVAASAYRRLERETEKRPKLFVDPESFFCDYLYERVTEAKMRFSEHRDLKLLEVMARMQHYGAATGLIDFTVSPLLALWFACQDERDSKGVAVDGKVVVVQLDDNPMIQEIKEHENTGEELDVYFPPDPDGKLRVWRPGNYDSRMITQQSLFIFGCPDIENFLARDPFYVSVDKKEIYIEILDNMGIAEGFVYPDFYGFSTANTPDKDYDLYLVDTYRTAKIRKGDQFADPNIKKVIAILSYFGTIDKQNPPERLHQKFAIAEDDFWKCVDELCKQKIVSISRKQTYKIRNQPLRPYYFYEAIIEHDILDFELFLHDYFSLSFMHQIMFTMLDNFNKNKIAKIVKKISPLVSQEWQVIVDKHQFKDCYDFAQIFYFIIPDAILKYIKQYINNLESNHEPPRRSEGKYGSTDEVFELLFVTFPKLGVDYTRRAIQLALRYSSRCTSVRNALCKYLVQNLAVDSGIQNYDITEQLFDVLLEETGEQNDVFDVGARTAADFLHMIYYNSDFSRQFDLSNNQKPQQLHEKILEQIRLLDATRFMIFLKQYTNRMPYMPANSNAKKLIEGLEFDSRSILNNIDNKYNPGELIHEILVGEYIDVLKKHEIQIKQSIVVRWRTKSRAYEIYRIIDSKVADLRERPRNRVTPQGIDELKQQKVSSLVKKYKDHEVIEIIDQLAEAEAFFSRIGSDMHWSSWSIYNIDIARAISKIFFATQDSSSHFVAVVRHYIDKKIPIDFIPPFAQFFPCYPDAHKELYGVLDDEEYPLKDMWKYWFFYSLPKKNIVGKYISDLELFLTNIKFDTRRLFHFDFLIKYEEKSPGLFLRIIQKLFDKRVENGVSFSLLFNPYSDIQERIEELFADNWEFLEKIFLYEIPRNSDVDNENFFLKVFLQKSPKFIKQYLNTIYSAPYFTPSDNGYQNYAFIWKLESCMSIMHDVILTTLKHQKYYFQSSSFMVTFFRIEQSHAENTAGVKAQQKEFIQNIINEEQINYETILLLVEVIKYFFVDDFPKFIRALSEREESAEASRALRSDATENSNVTPKDKLRFWDSLSFKFDDDERFSGGQQYIKERVEYWRGRIAEEKM